MTIGKTHRSLRGAVLDELRQLIVSGELEPGSRLVEESIAVRLDVSRNPVREALQTLAAEGFVDMLPRRGALVSRLSPEQAEELFDVRLALESLAARLAARNADEAAVSALTDVLEQAQDATAHRQLDRLAELNTRFHQLVVTAGANSYLEMLVAPMAQRVQRVFRRSAHSRATDSWDEHARMLAAITVGDEQAASVLAAAHVSAARESYRQLVAAEGSSGHMSESVDGAGEPAAP
ncbi:MAG: GntR family transcriptional regulator [Actinomycetota bacterium]|nr:GntR family transcriptional regulator [Actinomycetota bacterium]